VISDQWPLTSEDETRNFFAFFSLPTFCAPAVGQIVTIADHQSAEIIDFFSLFPMPDA
jgi:hypothetical protein